ncbi:hypothetical protein H0H81_012298 [Sphagnurus paluster]|uniref:Poly(A) RNA polymerase mitochondrial-like central palm domain-containing protein n=1 Tax=Sphagnurus paluster TaxID=117069 RepID=A0A9P7FY51_9AGAR|nr:hypothetical protein H0H81_012298 [Sphagnurus paluster]
MKDPSSSGGNREARRRTYSSRPYSERSSSMGGESSSSRRPRREDDIENKTRSPKPKRPSNSSKTKKNSKIPSEEDDCIQTPWLGLLSKDRKYDGVEQKLHHEILAYLQYMEPTPNEKRAREGIMASIRGVVHSRFRNAEIQVFGSSATGLGLPTSDIDIVVNIPHIPDVKQGLFQLASKFRNSGLTSSVFVNHRAHVPIIVMTLREEYGSISVDVGINNTLGMEGIKVMNEYLTRMPALRPLILLMKGFLRQRNLNDASKGGMGSYALACLCIHFLQANPSQRPQDYIDKPIETESLGFLLTDLMFYYGLDFPYRTSYISAAQGKVLLPKAKRSESLSIRCLIHPENDIAKSVQKVDSFLHVFKEAYATILQLTIPQESVLGQLVGVNQKFIAQRALLAATDRTIGAAGQGAHALPIRPPPPLPLTHTPRGPRTWKQNSHPNHLNMDGAACGYYGNLHPAMGLRW